MWYGDSKRFDYSSAREVDLFFIDGDHSYSGVYCDTVNVFDNRKEVDIRDFRTAILNTKLVYPDVIRKELVRFNEEFSDIYRMETPQKLKGE